MKITSITLLFLTFLSACCSAQSAAVKLVTTKGDIVLLLSDRTPKHRDAFLKAIKLGLYNDATFNRVIKSFVSQGGELDETILEREKQSPAKPLQRIPLELHSSLYHKKGALGAGRDENPSLSSYSTQIYLVAGKVHTDLQLDALEQKKGIRFSAEQREAYKTIGGTPHLDQQYTVFGEIVKGLDVATAINQAPIDANDLPLSPVTFKPEILSKKALNKILKH